MPAQVGLIVRLPSGTEHWYVSTRPEVGDVVTHAGRRYVVASIEEIEDSRAVLTLVDAPHAEGALASAVAEEQEALPIRESSPARAASASSPARRPLRGRRERL
jgi:hypothetical protein